MPAKGIHHVEQQNMVTGHNHVVITQSTNIWNSFSKQFLMLWSQITHEEVFGGRRVKIVFNLFHTEFQMICVCPVTSNLQLLLNFCDLVIFFDWSFSLIFLVKGCNSTSDLSTNLPASYDMVWPLWQWIPVISFLICFLDIESKYNENISNYHNLSAALLSVCKDLLSILPVPHTIIHGLNCLQHTWSPIFPNDNSICNFLGTSQLLYLIISCHVAHTAGFLSWNRNPPH